MEERELKVGTAGARAAMPEGAAVTGSPVLAADRVRDLGAASRVAADGLRIVPAVLESTAAEQRVGVPTREAMEVAP
jgi:hypothetical protein